ncbi:extracellular solute-binding protein [Desulfococcaceae bacterium HSG8]|nr:extracellular solute-binding protein [Desulfococcaceae bacterium HSG8]
MKVMKVTAMFFIVMLLFLRVPGAGAADNKRFDGVEIIVGVMDAPAIGSPATAHAKTWEKETGGKVRIMKYPFGELFGKFMGSLGAKEAKYDVIFYAPAWAGDFFPYLSELPEELTEDESFDDIHDTYRERLMQWDDKWAAVTIDGDLFNGYYRKDLFEGTLNRQEFKAKYGYDLTPPDTWKQYADIAEFFTGRTGPDGKKLYGATEVFARGGQAFWDVFSRASAYTNHPDHPGAQFFNPDNMKAQVNNSGWVRAVQEYAAILKFCPPGSKNYDLQKMRKAFASGQAVMTTEWGDTAQITADSEQSAVVGKVGYFVLPGTREIWNYKTGKWDKADSPHKAPFLAFGGWVGSVPQNSKKKQAAWDYIMWYASPKNSLHDVVTSGTGVNPYRFSHFTNIDAWTRAFSRRAASEYLAVLRASLDSPHVAPDLRIPGFHNYTEALEVQLVRILNHEIGVQEGLDIVAAEWEKITDKLGRDKQLAIYRSSMGL